MGVCTVEVEEAVEVETEEVVGSGGTAVVVVAPAPVGKQWL